MFSEINKKIHAEKAHASELRFIMEASMEIEDVLPGSDQEIEDVIDVDSVPDNAMSELDKVLDKIVDDPNYDDTEISDMINGDDDGDESGVDISEDEIEAALNEAVVAWTDDENIHHPNKDRRSSADHQPIFNPEGSIINQRM